VRDDYKGKGCGRILVNALLEEAHHQHVTCVCLFTRIPEFFAGMGFQIAERTAIPDKLYKDCVNCPRIHNCDETAMYRGELPSVAILAPPHATSESLLEILR
jgi:amino-acid N-acetyltransferase